MKAFLVVNLVLQSLVLLINIVQLMTCAYPKPRAPESIGSVSAQSIVGLGFIVWASILLSP